MQTRPNTRQSSRGRLGRSSNAKIARNSEMLPTYRRTDGPTDTARCRVACPRLKKRKVYGNKTGSGRHRFLVPGVYNEKIGTIDNENVAHVEW